jgi:hypothetical protein
MAEALHYIFRPIQDDDYPTILGGTVKLDGDFLQAIFIRSTDWFPCSVMPISGVSKNKGTSGDWFEGFCFRNGKRIEWDRETQ